MLLNEHWREAYNYLHGDKDTFLLAALLTGASQPAIEHRPLAADGDLIQRNPDGDPFLQHRTGSKWKLFGPNQPVDRDRNFRAVAMKRWPSCAGAGRARSSMRPSDRSARKAEEAKLIGQRRFRYAVSNSRPRRSRTAAGRSGRRRTHRASSSIGPSSSARTILCCNFSPDRGLWLSFCASRTEVGRGASIGHPGFDASLSAEEEWRTWPHANESASCARPRLS